MNKQEQIEIIENKIKELKQEVEKLKNENKGRWIPKENELYYFLDDYDDVIEYKCHNDCIDEKAIEHHYIFKTRGEAEHYRDYLKALKEATHDFTKEDWKNGGLDKWYICYNYSRKTFMYLCSNNVRNMNQKYFKTEKELIAFVSKWEKEIKEYEFGIYKEE